MSANPANVPDVLAAPAVIEGLYGRFKDGPFCIRDMLMDTGYDAAAMYTLCSRLNMRPIIPLHPNSAKEATERDGLKLDATGRPLCPGGAAMLRNGKTPNGAAVVWHCPAKPMLRSQGKMTRSVDLARCPLGSLCEPESKMGPLVQVDVEKHGRFSPEVPRNSQQFEELYKQRSSVERTNGGLKRALGERPLSSQGRLELWTACWMMWKHARAWVRQRFGELKSVTLGQLLELVKVLEQEARPG